LKGGAAPGVGEAVEAFLKNGSDVKTLPLCRLSTISSSSSA